MFPTSWEAAIADLLVVLAIVGGARALMYLVDWWRLRPRAAVRRYGETIDSNADRWTVTLEIENIGGTPNSFLPNARLTFVDFHGDRGETRLSTDEGADRSLPPFKPVNVSFTAQEKGALIGFSWYREITLPLAVGRPIRGRMRNASDREGMRSGQFWIQRLLHRGRLRYRIWLHSRKALGRGAQVLDSEVQPAPGQQSGPTG
jgi:hypothetical protein